MPFSLEPHVTFGMVGNRPIFLDLRRDRYFALDPGAEQAFLALAEAGSASEPDDAGLRRLVSAGLLFASSDGGRIEPVRFRLPEGSALDSNRRATRASMATLTAAWVAIASARLRLKRAPLHRLIDHHKMRKARALAKRRTPPSEAEVATLALRFMTARRLVPLGPNCLQDSLALAAWLARRSAFPSIVFGVKLDPFAAHCWLQSDRLVLNDAADTVSQFTPVLVL